MPELLPAPLVSYIEAMTSPEPEYLLALRRKTHLTALMPQMLSGHVQGRFLSFISRMIQPRRILEIGTYTGYSALCLAEGLHPEGKLITIDINEELQNTVQTAVQDAGFADRIEIITGNAAEIIPTLRDTFDLVFIDADKQQYALYLALVLPKMPVGAWLLADNVLWSGRVVEMQKDKDTLAIDQFNRSLADDPRMEQVVLSIRDGITLARKISD